MIEEKHGENLNAQVNIPETPDQLDHANRGEQFSVPLMRPEGAHCFSAPPFIKAQEEEYVKMVSL